MLRNHPESSPLNCIRYGVRAAAQVGRPTPHLYALSAVVAAYRSTGRPFEALLEKLLERVSRPNVPLEDVVLLRASLATHLDRSSLMPRTVPDSLHGGFAHTSWAGTWLHLLVDSKKYAEAVQFGDAHWNAVVDLRSGVGLLNMALALAAEGQDERGRVVSMLAARVSALDSRREILHIAQQLLLALGTEWPSRQWEDLRSVTPRKIEASVLPVLERVVARIDPNSPRTRWLQSALRESRSDQYRIDLAKPQDGRFEV